MNFKNLIAIAAILTMIAVALPVAAIDKYYESKYVPIAPDPGDGCGGLYVILLAHEATFSSSFVIQRIDPANIPFGSGQPATKELLALFTKEGNATVEQIPASGVWDDRLAPGVYTLTLSDGNGGQPEYRIVRIDTAGIEHVSFIGHAVSSSAAVKRPKPPVEPTAHIISAEYFGTWKSSFGEKNGAESVKSEIQDYIDANPTGPYTISADVGDIIINGQHLSGPDPAYGWVKTLAIVYSYEKEGHKHIGIAMVIEDDTGSYPGSNPLHLPTSAIIS